MQGRKPLKGKLSLQTLRNCIYSDNLLLLKRRELEKSLPCCALRLLRLALLRNQHCGKIIGHGAAEVVTLAQRAASHADSLNLLHCFQTFGNNGHVERR